VSKQSDPFELNGKIIGRLGKDYMINGRLFVFCAVIQTQAIDRLTEAGLGRASYVAKQSADVGAPHSRLQASSST
jgi:hypothetical protein